ncbi:GlxA family transcriptional regulator [Aquisediminimonas profunda]|uniref:GlxA family transcriptional regulator n=1 Tax=Aquisediminimonas profunda TaxID=1550733 RepID=UPI001C62F8E9|nr:DJ-1/PfpI family protein [Aquisediminimonas profunda]
MSGKTCFIIFDHFQLLDLTGPCSVLGAANDLLGRNEYDIYVLADVPGRVRSSCGVETVAEDVDSLSASTIDSVFIVGGDTDGLRALSRNASIREWVVKASKAARRFGSICSGSTVLASWGLIGSRRFATHWEATETVRQRWPELNLDAEAIFVADGPLWTSAGITTGIDMMLAIIEADHGPEAARVIAQRLVLSVRRPGWQSQFSAMLGAQAGRSGRYADLVAWIPHNLHSRLDVETLAARAGESLRSFHRNFVAVTGKSPAAFVALQRIDRARSLILEGLPLKQVAEHTGYADVARLSAAFQRAVGMSANDYRIVHAGSTISPAIPASPSQFPQPQP